MDNKIDTVAFLNSLDEPGEYDHPTRIVFRNRGIRHNSVAAALGVSDSLVSKVLRGESHPSPITEMNLQSLAMLVEEFDIYGSMSTEDGA